MGVPAVHSFMSENIMAVKQQKNVDRNNIDNAIFTETANMPLTSNADRPYPACFPNKFSIPFE